MPDKLDAVPAHASAAGMIYSFYGRLCVGNMDPDWLAEGNRPPTFYVYGTEDPFYRQFQQQYDVIRGMGIPYQSDWIHVTMTFGLEEYSGEKDMEAVIRAADQKLYRGKENGRNQIVY